MTGLAMSSLSIQRNGPINPQWLRTLSQARYAKNVSILNALFQINHGVAFAADHNIRLSPGVVFLEASKRLRAFIPTIAISKYEDGV